MVQALCTSVIVISSFIVSFTHSFIPLSNSIVLVPSVRKYAQPQAVTKADMAILQSGSLELNKQLPQSMIAPTRRQVELL